MAKKHKSNGKKPRLKGAATKSVVPPALKKTENRRERGAVVESRADAIVPRNPKRTANVEPTVAVAATPEREAQPTIAPFLFWARAPLAIMDFWFSRPERGRRAS